MIFQFWVAGVPQPQGSKVPGLTKDGRPYMREAAKGLKKWRQAVAWEATRQCTEIIWSAPVALHCTFFFPRPKSHFRANGSVKPQFASVLKTSRPDVDKMLRAIGDACSGILWRDDAQIADGHGLKYWTLEEPGVLVRVWEMEEPENGKEKS